MPKVALNSKTFFTRCEVRENGCWEWLGSLTKHGYGQLFFGGKMRSAHRVAYEVHNGPIYNGLHVCHTCDNRKCINPSHFFLGTHADNMRDMVKKGRRPVHRKGTPWRAEKKGRRKPLCVITHCVNGHEITTNNKYSKGLCSFCKTWERLRKKPAFMAQGEEIAKEKVWRYIHKLPF